MTHAVYVAGQLPRLNLQDLPADAVVLCTTPRLARDLRLEHNQLQAATGATGWATLQTGLLADWLDACMERALLCGRLLAAGMRPAERVLSRLQERLLWQQAIKAVEGEDEAQPLLDDAGLARLAQEAQELLEVWQLPLASVQGQHSQETQQFLRWQAAYAQLCARHQAQDGATHLAWQLQLLARADVLPDAELPACVVLAGFDRFSPQEEMLARVLAQRGVKVYELAQGLSAQATAAVQEAADVAAECQAAVAWVLSEFAAARAAGRALPRLGLVVPDLAALRAPLAALLDEALQPETLRPQLADAPRQYNFSLGEVLSEQPVVHAALRWLELLAAPQSLELTRVLELLRSPWSAPLHELDGRARLDVRLRRQLPAQTTLWRLQQALARCPGGQGLETQLAAAQDWLAAQPSQALPSAWAAALATALAQLGWPGGRSLTSHEFQACEAWEECLATLAELDALLGRVKLAEAVRQLRQICQERIFQPQTEGDPPLQIMGLLETAGRAFDALWVLGMNDHVWPPAARPNALLPAELQRAHELPNASAAVQEAFARRVQARLMRSAPRLIFSWSRMEGERELRPTPLLAGLPRLAEEVRAVPLPGLIEQLASAGPGCEALDDSRAPALPQGQHVAGGAALLRAQALCPAWAFYRYRLLATSPDSPLEELDERQRGSLLHAVLQAFWQRHGEEGGEIFRQWDDERLAQEIDTAVQAGLQRCLAELALPLSARQQQLERTRLVQLLQQWLALEAERKTPFVVSACEAQHELEIAGLRLTLRSDRIDSLADGRQLVIDYKTGSQLALKGWLGERLAEPQLPLYAALVLPQLAQQQTQQQAASATAAAAVLPQGALLDAAASVAGLSYARVRLDDCGCVGLSAEAELLPGVKSLEKAGSFKDFASWAALLEHWQRALTTVAEEVREGVAGVRLAHERDVLYCDVRPLLRLAERHEQMLAAGLFVEELESAGEEDESLSGSGA